MNELKFLENANYDLLLDNLTTIIEAFEKANLIRNTIKRFKYNLTKEEKELIGKSVQQNYVLSDKEKAFIKETIQQASKLKDGNKVLIEKTLRQKYDLTPEEEALIEKTINQSTNLTDEEKSLIELTFLKKFGLSEEENALAEEIIKRIDSIKNSEKKLKEIEEQVAKISKEIESTGNLYNNDDFSSSREIILANTFILLSELGVESTLDPTGYYSAFF